MRERGGGSEGEGRERERGGEEGGRKYSNEGGNMVRRMKNATFALVYVYKMQ